MSETVTRQFDPDRFEISVAEGVAGFAQFVDRDGKRVFFHTEIDPQFGGRGLGDIVVGQALDATRAQGLRVVPVCPFVKKYVERHAAYDDLVDPITPADLASIPHR